MKIPTDFWSVSCALMEQDHRYQELLADCKACEPGLEKICNRLPREDQEILETFVCASLEMGFRLASLVAAHYAAYSPNECETVTQEDKPISYKDI